MCIMNRSTPSKLDRPEILAAIFHPRKEDKTALPPSCTEFAVPIPGDDVTLGCRFYLADPDAASIVYFHGNGETVGDYDHIAPFYVEAGLNILVAGYRGYGWSSGEPSVSNLYADSAIVLDSFMAYCKSNGLCDDIFVMGRSLGSAASIDIGYWTPEKIKGIIIESGFANSLSLAARLGYDVASAGISEEDCFNNLAKIQDITIPTLILHGAEDQLIPLHEAVKLQADCGARTKQLFVVPGADHNSLITCGGTLYFETIKHFTDTVTNRNTWRQRRKKFKSQQGRT